MKIVVFHRANDYTGSTRVISNIIQSKFEADQVVVVANNMLQRGFLDEVPNLKLVAIWYPTIGGKRIKGFSFIAGQIHLFLLSVYYAFTVDLFYINTITQYVPALVGGLCRKKTIIHVHEKFVKTGLEVRVMEWTLRTVHAKRVFVSNWLQQQFRLVGTEDVVEYNKLSASFLDQVVPRVYSVRKRNQIIMLSSLTKAKGVEVLLQIAKLLPQYQFTWIVSAPKEEVITFFKGQELASNLSIVSSPENIHPYLQQADLLLNLSDPSQWIETFGMTILEAMPYGIPAIVPQVGGPAELVIDGFNGYCVDVTHANQVANAIQQAFSEQNYPQLVQNTFDRFKQIN